MESCKSVEAVFVTGSGQTADVDSKEYISFARTMNEVADNANIKFTIYRLGKDYQLGEDNVRHRYPALPVGPSHLPRTFWADWNNGESGSYSWSVDEGVEELVAYVGNRYINGPCKESRVIFGGISQGANVLDRAMWRLIKNDSTGFRFRIDYVSTYGDPKLWIPEGEGDRPAACSRKARSVWFSGVNDLPCWVHSGSLGPAQPYSPFGVKTGMWCRKKDFVCGASQSARDTAEHLKYDEGQIQAGTKTALKAAAQNLANPCTKKSILHAIVYDRRSDDDCDALATYPITKTSQLRDSLNKLAKGQTNNCDVYIAYNNLQLLALNNGSMQVYSGAYDFTNYVKYAYLTGCHVGLISYYSYKGSYNRAHIVTAPTRDLNVLYNSLNNIQYHRVDLSRNNIQSYQQFNDSDNILQISAMETAIDILPQSRKSDTRLLFLPVFWFYRDNSALFREMIAFALRKEVDLLNVNDCSGEYHTYAEVQPHVIRICSQVSYPEMYTASQSSTKSADSTQKITQKDTVEESEIYAIEPEQSAYRLTPSDGELRIAVTPKHRYIDKNSYESYTWTNLATDEAFGTLDPEATIVFTKEGDFDYRVDAKTYAGVTVSTEIKITTSPLTSTDRQYSLQQPARIELIKAKENLITLKWSPADIKYGHYVRIDDEVIGLLKPGINHISVEGLDSTYSHTAYIQSVSPDQLQMSEPVAVSLFPDGSASADDEWNKLATQDRRTAAHQRAVKSGQTSSPRLKVRVQSESPAAEVHLATEPIIVSKSTKPTSVNTNSALHRHGNQFSWRSWWIFGGLAVGAALFIGVDFWRKKPRS